MGQIFTVAEAMVALDRFNEKLKDARIEKKKVQQELASCLASGASIGRLQRQSAELDALLAAAPDAEKELRVQLERAKPVEKIARPRLETVSKKIKAFEQSLDEAATRMEEAWKGVVNELEKLGDLELPTTWRLGIKTTASKDMEPVVSELLGVVGAEGSQPGGRRKQAQAAFQNLRSEVEKFCDQ